MYVFPIAFYIIVMKGTLRTYGMHHRLRTPGEEIAFTARPKIKSNPKFLGTAEAYFFCHIGPFQISLIYAFIGCP